MNSEIVVAAWVYTAISVALAFIGVMLARMVTVSEEDKRLGRKQTYRETGPLTWIGILIVGPFIWHFDIPVPWASLIGLGVGYSVRIMLKIFGSGAAGAARAIVRQAADALDGDTATPAPPAVTAAQGRPAAAILPPDNDGPDGPARASLIRRLDDVPSVAPAPRVDPGT